MVILVKKLIFLALIYHFYYFFRSKFCDFEENVYLCDSNISHAGGSADIHVTSDGRFLYASHRLQGDGISIYQIDPQTGLPQRIGYQLTGVHPRNFTLSPSERFLLVACRDSNRIQILERDAQTGLLRDTGRYIDTPKPMFVKFLKRVAN